MAEEQFTKERNDFEVLKATKQRDIQMSELEKVRLETTVTEMGEDIRLTKKVFDHIKWTKTSGSRKRCFTGSNEGTRLH